MRLNIEGNKMIVAGHYGEYEISESSNGGFLASVLFRSFVNETDETGDTYLVEKGEAWKVKVDGLSGINTFIMTCEDAKLWNIIKGIAYRIKLDDAKGILYIRGVSRNYIIGEESGRLFMDETTTQKPHRFISGLSEAVTEIIQCDKWWARNPEETIEITESQGSSVEITDSGHLRFRMRSSSAVVGQKEDGSYWIVIEGSTEKHSYHRDTLKEVFKVIASGRGDVS